MNDNKNAPKKHIPRPDMRIYLLQLLTLVFLTTLSFASFSYNSIESLEVLELDINQCTPQNTLIANKGESLALHQIKQNQSMCLRATMTLAQAKTNQALTINMLASRKIYWDDQLLGQDGTVANSADEAKAGPIRTIHPVPNQLLTQGKHTLTIALSSFHISEQISSLVYSLFLHDTKQSYTRGWRQTILPASMIGALLIIGLFFQAIFWLYQRSASYQLFSLLCLCAGLLLAAEHFRAWYSYPYNWHITRLHTIIALTYLTLLLLNWFYLSFYQLKHQSRYLIIINVVLVAALFFDPRYDAKSIIMFVTSMLSCLAINIIALQQRQAFATIGTGLFASIILILALSPISVIYSFIEQWFIVIHIAIVLTIMASLISQMQQQRRQAITAARLELDLLKRNLQPHFLMNSLTLIIEWIEIKPQAAVKFVAALADNLRDLVQLSTASQISINDEINLCKQHLTIMGYRYNCDYQLQVNAKSLDLTIPPAVILTQLENAFAHNRIPDNSQFQLNIENRHNTQTIELISPYQPNNRNKRRIKDDSDTGTGEKYIHARLAELYGKNYQYQSFAQQQQWINRITYRPE